MSKKRILFIPADVIKSEVSRSFYFARFFAEENELFFLSRLDPQNAYFEKRKVSKFYTLKCFLYSLITSTRFLRHPKWGYEVIEVPFMSHMVIHRFLGMVKALKLARWFNKIQLERIAKKVKPDFIFYAEGFDLYPCIDGYDCVSDIQDDFDPGNFRDNTYNLEYTSRNILKSKINFVVSRQAAKKFTSLYGGSFEYIPNGVESKVMLGADKSLVKSLRSQLGLDEKFIITYIGADAWYNKDFTVQLAKLSKELDSSLHFLIVGNLSPFKAENVTFVGPVDKEKSILYYWLSDIGILLKDSKGSNFLRNSVPLKIVQYGIIGKQFLSPPIVWLEEEGFNNVRVVKDFFPENIVSNIIALKKDNYNSFDPKWKEYDWNTIVKTVMKKIHEKLD